MEHREADVRQVAGCGASGDDAARFLRELRQLRDRAGLGHAELAARAHFPYDFIRAAEVGPELPDLPVLCAYVRGCGGTTEEWEERWRSLTSSPSLPVSASRHAGTSDAATAGARIGSVSQVGENPDPSIIIAALSRVAEDMASPSAGTVPQSPDVQQAGEFPSPAAFPLDSEAFPSDSEALPLDSEAFPPGPEAFPSAPEPMTSNKPAGWDPIRVSTAWPVIRDTPTVAAEPARSTGPSGDIGMGVPWGTAPWAGDPRGAKPSATRRSGSAAKAGGGSGSARSASWIRVVVIVAVLVCVFAVLLAVFA